MGVEGEVIINIININAGISINVIILRVTHWLHVPWRSNENVPAIFWDKQPLRELLQHARDGIKPAPGSSMDNVMHYVFLPRVFSTMAMQMGWTQTILLLGE